jgi:hypothetical protein
MPSDITPGGVILIRQIEAGLSFFAAILTHPQARGSGSQMWRESEVSFL